MSPNTVNLNYMNDSFVNTFNQRQGSRSATEPNTVELDHALHSDKDTKWLYSGNRDDFYSISSFQNERSEYSSEEKALVRKIDLLLMPLICTLDFLQVNILQTILIITLAKLTH